MIYLDIVGRCGNQMFQYAFARKLSLLNNDELTVDFHLVDVYANKLNNPTFRDELCNFWASENYKKIVDGSNKVYQYGSKKQVFVFKIYTKIKRFFQKFCKDNHIANKLLYRVMSHYGIYWYLAPKKQTKCKEKNKFVFGYFEDPAYFDDIRTLLIKEFRPKHPVNAKSSQLLNTIEEDESVCISFRKWELPVEEKNNREICDKNYYEQSVRTISKKLTNPTFIVFSDDVDWVKENFDLPANCYFERGDDSVYDKIRLMSACKHFILSNSTFAWWVQYLGQAKDKIVISPSKWYNTDKKKSPLITKDFTTIG